ncbi:ABC transporter permease [Lapillicoccus jejuensis]|uniref:Peptide/nickel transport system permease protein n=2 Tax=Lapillicoccus jejuensis TaxID=402171 RepID=A0A542DWF5_9MICO|nr:peptide/nickel transport system permease protein [Lapillicoccus jejuensis]
MFFYIIRRLISAVAMLFVITLATYLLFFASPIDPASLTCSKNCTPAVIEGNRVKLGYDKPIPVQYANFLKGFVTTRYFPDDPELRKTNPQAVFVCDAPCLGYSALRTQGVTDMVKTAAPATASIAIAAFVMWIVFGVGFGIIAALKRGRWQDRLLVGVSLVGYSLPTFFIGTLLYVFVSVQWGIIPISNVGYFPIGDNGPIAWAVGITLPALTLAAVYAASYVRLTRAYMLETLSEDYIRTARAKGVKERTVIRRHGLRAALTPIVTAAGLDLGGLLGGAIISEQVFNIQGLGKMAIVAIQQTDLPSTVGVVLVAAFFIVIANLIVDVLYGVIDPRVRLA